jgi:hypothetical protein
VSFPRRAALRTAARHAQGCSHGQVSGWTRDGGQPRTPLRGPVEAASVPGNLPRPEVRRKPGGSQCNAGPSSLTIDAIRLGVPNRRNIVSSPCSAQRVHRRGNPSPNARVLSTRPRHRSMKDREEGWLRSERHRGAHHERKWPRPAGRAGGRAPFAPAGSTRSPTVPGLTRLCPADVGVRGVDGVGGRGAQAWVQVGFDLGWRARTGRATADLSAAQSPLSNTRDVLGRRVRSTWTLHQDIAANAAMSAGGPLTGHGPTLLPAPKDLQLPGFV